VRAGSQSLRSRFAAPLGGTLNTVGRSTRDFGDFAEDPDDPTGSCCRGLAATPKGNGLWGVGLNGVVQTLGKAPALGNFVTDEEDPLISGPRGLVATLTGQGLWGFSANGIVQTLGDAVFFGDLRPLPPPPECRICPP
jgi:hypothetical protein